MHDLADYLNGAYQHVHGWVYPGAIAALSACNRLSMSKASAEMGACEIGIHHGKFFLALLACTSRSAKSAAIDIFENQDLNVDKSGLGSKDKFLSNLDKFYGSSENIQIITSDSLSFNERRIAELEAHCGKFRYFSVDGGHTKIHARNDIRIAESLTANGGFVIVDDFFHPDWPGVTQGIYEYVIYDCPKLSPLCIAGRKLFMTTIDAHGDFYASLRSELYRGRKKSPVKEIELFGYKALSFDLHQDDPIIV